MHQRMRPSDGWAPGTAIAIALAAALPGCSSSAAMTAPPDYLEVFDNTYVIAGDVPAGSGRLAGPHFDLQIARVVTTSELSGSLADSLDLVSPLQAADDHEFVVATMARDFEPPRWSPDDANLEVAVIEADQRRPLARGLDFLSGVNDMTLVASVPKGAPVLLQVTDEGRPLSIDLRDGSPTAESNYQVSYSQELQPLDYEEAGVVAASGRTRPLQVAIASYWSSADRHSLEPFVPTAGWARPGRSWLLVKGLHASSTTITDAGLFGFSMTFDLDVAATFGLALQDGTTIPAQARQPLRLDDSSGITSVNGFPVIFDMPDSFRTGTLQITPAGTMTAYVDGASVPADWEVPPTPAQVPIDFQP